MQYPLTYIHPDAIIGENVIIEPFVKIEGDVVIGDNTWIGSHACIMSGSRIGKNCKIHSGAIVGSTPQDLKYAGEYTTLEIGDNTIIREYCTLNKGTNANGKTIIGKNNLLMAYVHVAHDCKIGNNCILANNVNLAGHIVIEDFAILGGLTAVHQFVRIGAHAMLSGGSLVGKDIPPYVKAARLPITYAGVNSIGLRRRGFSNEQINNILDVYRILYVKGYNISQAQRLIEDTVLETPERNYILEFIQSSERGVIKGPRLNGHKISAIAVIE